MQEPNVDLDGALSGRPASIDDFLVLLLTLDEAHEAAPDILGRLLNAAQLAGGIRPIAVVFAGTPGLEATLHAAHTSFWSRGRTLPVGLLDKTSAIEALARPLQSAGIEADERAIEELARAADNYPYFLQLYGEAAWNPVEASDGRAFLPEHMAPTLAAADRPRRNFYRHRYREFGAAGLLPVARRVAEAFVASAEAPADRRLTDAALDALPACEGGGDHKAFLFARGYVWQDDSGDPSWTPGIPRMGWTPPTPGPRPPAWAWRTDTPQPTREAPAEQDYAGQTAIRHACKSSRARGPLME